MLIFFFLSSYASAFKACEWHMLFDLSKCPGATFVQVLLLVLSTVHKGMKTHKHN